MIGSSDDEETGQSEVGGASINIQSEETTSSIALKVNEQYSHTSNEGILLLLNAEYL